MCLLVCVLWEQNCRLHYHTVVNAWVHIGLVVVWLFGVLYGLYFYMCVLCYSLWESLPSTHALIFVHVSFVWVCVYVCVCLTSHLGELTEWRICAVIVVWLSSCCNWKCLIGETFVKMFIRACHLTLTQLLLLPVQLLKCSPPLTLDAEPVPSWNWVNYHTNCLVWTACS